MGHDITSGYYKVNNDYYFMEGFLRVKTSLWFLILSMFFLATFLVVDFSKAASDNYFFFQFVLVSVNKNF